MLSEILKEVLAEVRLEKQASHEEPALAPPVSQPEQEAQPTFSKISSDEAEYLKAKLSMMGLGKYAAYVDEMNDVAGELVHALLDEMEKVASTANNPFRVSDRPDLSNVDPITKFALS